MRLSMHQLIEKNSRCSAGRNYTLSISSKIQTVTVKTASLKRSIACAVFYISSFLTSQNLMILWLWWLNLKVTQTVHLSVGGSIDPLSGGRGNYTCHDEK